jgi:hypothetical protein
MPTVRNAIATTQAATRPNHSPKFPAIRQTGLFEAKILTVLIWQQVRPQFRPAPVANEQVRIVYWVKTMPFV